MVSDVMAEQGIRPQGMRVAGLALVLVAPAVLGACVGRREPVRDQRPAEVPPVSDVQRVPGQTRNHVAVLVPLTGPNAGVGTSIANAANLALLDSKELGIKLTVYDTGPGAAAVANRALAEGNRLFLGPLLAEDVRAVAPIARGEGVPVIAFSNDVGVAGRGTYIMGFTPDQSIGRAVAYARGKGSVRFAGLMPTNAYGERAGLALRRAVTDAGGRLVAVQNYQRGTASLTAAVQALGGKGGYDALVVGDTPSVAAGAVSIVRGGPSRPAQVIGTELWSVDRTLGRNATLRGAWFAGVPDTRFEQLVTRYRARYGKTPFRLASLGYDGVLLAVRSNRDWGVGSRFPERTLTEPDGFSGVDGAFRFNRDGTAERRMAVHEVTARGPVVVAAADASFGD